MSGSSPERRFFGRTRRENVEGGRAHSHRVRVSPEEEGQLVRLALAHNVSVPRLLVESALAEAGETPTDRRELATELFAVHRLLASLANNINQIARATNATHEQQVETVEVLRAVRRVAARIDETLDGLSAQ